MIALPHGPSGLPKATWTNADFEDRGWHGCRVHAVSIGESEDDTLPPARLLLDLDSIVRWVAPATLVFEAAWNITARLGPLHDLMEITDLHRLDSPDNYPDSLWHVEGQNLELHLRAPGDTQNLRFPPCHVSRQVLTAGERAGIGFAEQPFT